MPRVTNAEARSKERRAVGLHLAGLKFDDIAEQVGYKSRGAAYEAVMRAIRRETIADLEEIRTSEVARVEQLWLTFYPLARRGDPVALDKCVKLLERRAKYLGLDHADGLAERQTALAEEQGELIVKILRAVIEDAELDLTEGQKQVAKARFSSELRALSAVS